MAIYAVPFFQGYKEKAIEKKATCLDSHSWLCAIDKIDFCFSISFYPMTKVSDSECICGGYRSGLRVRFFRYSHDQTFGRTQKKESRAIY